MKYAYVHEAIAAALHRKFPKLQVTSDYPPGEPNSYVLDIKGGTKAEREDQLLRSFSRHDHPPISID